MRCPSGIMFSRVLFVVVNMALVWAWACQLVEVRKERERERVESEIRWWEGVLEELEGLRGVKDVGVFLFFL